MNNTVTSCDDCGDDIYDNDDYYVCICNLGLCEACFAEHQDGVAECDSERDVP